MCTVQRLLDFPVDIAVRTSLCRDVLQFEICEPSPDAFGVAFVGFVGLWETGLRGFKCKI